MAGRSGHARSERHLEFGEHRFQRLLTLHLPHHGLGRRVTAALSAFADLLRKWNKTVNLVSPADLDQLWPRHVEDSLQLGTIAGPLPARAIDLGSGAGFP